MTDLELLAEILDVLEDIRALLVVFFVPLGVLIGTQIFKDKR